MPIHYGSRQFRKKIGLIIKESISQNDSVLIYNEKYPTQSFFVSPFNNYIETVNYDKANEYKKLFEYLQTKRSLKFKNLVLKRYDKKNIQSE